MAAGWFDGMLVDGESCDLMVVAGARQALVDFLALPISDESRALVRELLAGIDRGARAFAAARTQVAGGGDGASSSPVVLSRDEVAGRLGVTVQQVSNLCGAGHLTGRKLRGRWQIDESSLLRELDRRGA